LNAKNFFLIFLISFLVFLPFFLFNGFIGVDPYFFLNKVCLKQELLISFSNPFLFNLILSFLPCNFFVLKLLMFFLTFIFLIYFFKFIELFSSEFEKNFIVFSLFSCFVFVPVFLVQFFKFENDLFALPFISAFLFYGFKFKFYFKLIDLIKALICFIIAVLFWVPSFFFISALIPLLFLISIFLLFFFKPEIILPVIFPDYKIAEGQPLIGLIAYFFLYYGLFSVPKILWFPLILSLILSALNLKFSFFSVFFLLIGFNKFLSKTFSKNKKSFYFFIILILVFYGLIFVRFFYLNNLHPNEFDWSAINWFKENYNKLSALKKVNNNWGLSYWLEFKGIPITEKPGIHLTDYNNSFLLTTLEMNDCNLIKSFQNTEIKLYEC